MGLDAGAPIGGGAINKGAWDAVASTGVGWVRINFLLDQWSSPADVTPRGPDKLSWLQAYDAIVDGYLARGIRVYGLLNDELVAGVADRNSDAFVDAFVANALVVVGHFKNRVRVYEVINEPTRQPRQLQRLSVGLIRGSP